SYKAASCRIVPYEVIQISFSVASLINVFRSFGVPEITAISKSGAKRSISLRQLLITDDGTITRCGSSLGYDNKYAIFIYIFIIPISLSKISQNVIWLVYLLYSD